VPLSKLQRTCRRVSDIHKPLRETIRLCLEPLIYHGKKSREVFQRCVRHLDLCVACNIVEVHMEFNVEGAFASTPTASWSLFVKYENLFLSPGHVERGCLGKYSEPSRNQLT
jgi:hypothetical protein